MNDTTKITNPTIFPSRFRSSSWFIQQSDFYNMIFREFYIFFIRATCSAQL